MITEEMWQEGLKTNTTQAQRKERHDNLQQTRFVGQAMSEIKSDPRWKSYADHIVGLKDECERRADIQGTAALEETDPMQSVARKAEYHQFKIRAFAYDHVLKLIEALIERGETATEQLKEIEYGET